MFKSKYSGFLLIELVVSIGIFAIVSLLALSFYWHINKLNLENELEIRAINIASSCLERVQASGKISQPFDSLTLAQGERGVEDKFNVSVAPVSIKKGYKKSFALIEITVSWNPPGHTERALASRTYVTGVLV